MRWTFARTNLIAIESNIFAKNFIMGHSHEDHHGHEEAEQNEIGGPVVFALVCLTLAILIIFFLV